jgi:hypothetical protein
MDNNIIEKKEDKYLQIKQLLKKSYNNDLLFNIVDFLDFKEMYNLQKVNKNCYNVIKKNMDFQYFINFYNENINKPYSEIFLELKLNLADLNNIKKIQERQNSDLLYRLFYYGYIYIKHNQSAKNKINMNIYRATQIKKINEFLEIKTLPKNNNNKKKLKQIKNLF